MTETIECPECHQTRPADAAACPHCAGETAEQGKRTLFRLSPEKIIFLLFAGWLLVHLFNTFGGKLLPARHTTLNYAAISSQLDGKIAKALPMYAGLRHKLIPIIQDHRLASGTITDAMKEWSEEERALQEQVQWKGASIAALQHAPPAIAPQLMMRIEALTNLAIADNVLYQAWKILIGSCNGTLSAYTPSLRAADAAVVRAKAVLAGDYLGRPYNAAIVSEPAYLANAHPPAKLCPD